MAASRILDHKWVVVAIILMGLALFGCGGGIPRGNDSPAGCQERSHGWDPCRNGYQRCMAGGQDESSCHQAFERCVDAVCGTGASDAGGDATVQ
jgi:hypothetical protein